MEKKDIIFALIAATKVTIFGLNCARITAMGLCVFLARNLAFALAFAIAIRTN